MDIGVIDRTRWLAKLQRDDAICANLFAIGARKSGNVRKAGALTIAARDPSIAIDRSSRSAVRRARLRYGSASVRFDGPLVHRCCKALFRLVQRIAAAEAVLLATAALCALAGLPAVLTAFIVALVSLVVNIWIAVRTLGPMWRKHLRGGAA